MKSSGLVTTLFAALVVASRSAGAKDAKGNPIAKVLDMLDDLEQEVIKEGQEAHKLYTEFKNYCHETSNELHFEIKTGKQELAKEKATIEKSSADVAEYTENIDSEAAIVSESESELKAAIKVRKKEHEDFLETEKELVQAKDTIERAIAIVTREMKAGASFAQLKGTDGVVQALSVMTEASSVSTADASTLTALLQSAANSDDDDTDEEEPAAGAPAGKVYESHSGGVVDTMENLLEKTETQLEDLRKEETKTANAFALTRQSLENKIKTAKEGMAEAKKDLAAASETKAKAEGDETVTDKDLKADIESLAGLHHDCEEKASNFEEETNARGEEMKALAEAKKIIKETTGGAEGLQYKDEEPPSLLQLESTSRQGEEAVHYVRNLARKHRSGALMQLASRMEVAVRSSSKFSMSEDPFAKVKGLIEDLIARIKEEMSADATQKAFCDKELKENNLKKSNEEDDISEATAKIESMTAQSKSLRAQAATLQKELADIAKRKEELTKLRQEEKAVYDENSAKIEEGLEGVKSALKILRDYYGQQHSDQLPERGASGGIIGLLEVCESDFQKALTEMNAAEDSAVDAFNKEETEMATTAGAKEVDVKYKTKEATSLDKSVAEITSDREGMSEELDAVNTYLDELRKQCIAKPETFEERAKARADEIAGLKEALEILGGESFLQVHRTVRHTLRGAVLQAS